MIKAIIAILNKLACCHVWAIKKEIFNYSNESIKMDMPTSSTILYCCEKCGKFKKIKL